MTEERFYVKKVTKEERPKLFSSVGADYKYFIVDKSVGSMIFNFGVNRILADKVCDLLNKQDKEIEYWKENAMTLLLQVRRLLPRMTDKEIAEYSKELEKIQDERQIQ